jgi:hypothetical protein
LNVLDPRYRSPGMIFPLIGVRLHGWLDDLVVIVYLLGAAALHLRGAALAVALAGAGVHFLLTRLTNYPQGTVKIIPFRVHAFIELGEGAAVLAAAIIAPFGLGVSPLSARLFLGALGLSQFAAFSFSDYGTPRTPRAP